MLIRAGESSRPAMRGAPVQPWIAALLTLYGSTGISFDQALGVEAISIGKQANMRQ